MCSVLQFTTDYLEYWLDLLYKRVGKCTISHCLTGSMERSSKADTWSRLLVTYAFEGKINVQSDRYDTHSVLHYTQQLHFENTTGWSLIQIWLGYLCGCERSLHKCLINCLSFAKFRKGSSLWLLWTRKTWAKSCLLQKTPIYLLTVLSINSLLDTCVSSLGYFPREA